MKRLLLGMAVAFALGALLFREDHYDAIRHEFYQVWDSLEELRAEK